MVLIQDIFYLKFGKARDAKALLNEFKEIVKKHNFPMGRILTDLVTNHSYTLIMESEWNSISDWENSMKDGAGMDDWQKWYQKFIPLCDSAKREIYSIVE
jgi:hypothetical protein